MIMIKKRFATAYTDELKEFSRFVYEKRLDMDKNLKEVHTEFGLDPTSLRGLELSKSMPVISNVVKICKAYKISLDRFFKLGNFKNCGGIPIPDLKTLQEREKNMFKRRGNTPKLFCLNSIISKDKKFVEKLREKRFAKNLTIKELSEKIGIKRTSIGEYERGFRLPNKKDLEILKNFYKK